MKTKQRVILFIFIIIFISSILFIVSLKAKAVTDKSVNKTAIEKVNQFRNVTEVATTNESKLNITLTNTPTPTNTSTPTPIPTNTPIPTSTPTPAPTATCTPTPLLSSYSIYEAELTDEEKRDMAALVYLEAGGENYECQKGVASVILNRMIRYNLSLNEVMYAPNAFSPAAYITSTTPSQSCIDVVNDVLQNGSMFPLEVCAFRADYYHDFGTPYMNIGPVYFSTT